jgi:hypothetical protein
MYVVNGILLNGSADEMCIVIGCISPTYWTPHTGISLGKSPDFNIV